MPLSNEISLETLQNYLTVLNLLPSSVLREKILVKEDDFTNCFSEFCFKSPLCPLGAPDVSETAQS